MDKFTKRLVGISLIATGLGLLSMWTGEVYDFADNLTLVCSFMVDFGAAFVLILDAQFSREV